MEFARVDLSGKSLLPTVSPLDRVRGRMVVSLRDPTAGQLGLDLGHAISPDQISFIPPRGGFLAR